MKKLVGAVVTAVAVMVAGSVVATPASAATNDQVVQAWYRVYLQRSAADAASDTGRSYWTGRLDRGDTRESVLHDILVSREYVTDEIGEYYSRYLGRRADDGARYWIDGVVRGDFVAEWAAQLILNSDEYYRTWTSGSADANGQFIRSLYFDLLQRSAGQGEVDYWRGVLARDGRLAVVRGIWYAQEAVTVRLDRHYVDFLDRRVDPAGLSYWSPVAVASDLAVRFRLGSTEEFARTWAG
jgi:hypothetical protein